MRGWQLAEDGAGQRMAVTVATVRLKSWLVFFSAVRNPFKAFIDWIENVSHFSFFQEKLDGEVSRFNVAVSSLCGLMAESFYLQFLMVSSL